jgi:hypothetical protein
MEIHYGATEIVSDIMNAIGNNPQAIRGAAIIASTLMTILTEMPRNLESEQREMEYCYKFITTGLPALLLNVLTHENVINAKNSLEGVPKL